MRKLGHPILDAVAKINPKYIEETDIAEAPVDPQEFLDWWWETQGSICQRCVLSENRNRIVRPDGIATAPIMVIGEGPGFLEDLAGIPLVGSMELQQAHCGVCRNVSVCYEGRIKKQWNEWGKKRENLTPIRCSPDYDTSSHLPRKFFLYSAGAVLDGILLHNWKYAYPRHNWIERHNTLHPTQPWTHASPWYITNTVMCRSTDVTGTRDETPDSVPKSICRRHLAMQWAAIQPKVIVALGQVAMEVLVGSETKAKRAPKNEIVQTRFGPVIYQAHPAHFMREKNREAKGYGYAKTAEALRLALEYTGLAV